MDEIYMNRALELAKLGEGHVNPNPLVGAVIVKGGRIIGEGYHKKFGQPHAEVEAFKSAKENLDGATMYVTLEPCSHYGKTPPCADKIIEMKIRKVVIGMVDPNTLVAGKGIQKLKSAGIEVVVGVLEESCKKLNEIFIKYIQSKLPFVVLKAGMSLDGKIATSFGESKWITSDEARNAGQVLRKKLSAIMVGVNTVINDDPELTCRIENGVDPIRVVVDSKLRVPLKAKILSEGYREKTIIATTKKASSTKRERLEGLGVRVLEIEEKNSRVDLKYLMRSLGELNIDSILIEGGGELNNSALEEGIVDKINFFVAPIIIGGNEAKGAIGGDGIQFLKDAYKIENLEVKSIGRDLSIEGYIKR